MAEPIAVGSNDVGVVGAAYILLPSAGVASSRLLAGTGAVAVTVDATGLCA